MNASLSRRRIVQATGAALASAALPALAQSGWPNRPIRIVVPYTAGGFTDQMARLLTVGLQKQLGQPVVITPHPGEMARLVGVSTGVVQKDRPGVASRFAIDFGCVVVLKGHETVVATPEGEVFKNPTGNSGMATGGTGDVLSGLIGGLMAQGLNSTYAAVVGTYLHGLAGDIAAETKTERGLIARDVIEAIPQAWGRLENTLKTSEGN